jgi:hypothetical protein
MIRPMPKETRLNKRRSALPFALAAVLTLAATAIVTFFPARPTKPTPGTLANRPAQLLRREGGKNAEGLSSPTRGLALYPEYAPEAPSASQGGNALHARKVSPAREGEKGTLIIVIDDAGYSLSQLKAFLDLPFPLTVAVLPSLPQSAEAAALVLASGKELILHQPMESRNHQDPGPDALMLGMDGPEAQRLVEANMASLPGISGMNNHMGSAVTQDASIMGAVLELAQKKGIYYLDSLTTSGSTTREIARRINLRHWERDVFLDNAQDRTSILRAMDEGKKIASANGAAVMIGHVWSADLAKTLMEIYPGLVDSGYSLSSIARFMMNQSDPEYEDDADSGD